MTWLPAPELDPAGLVGAFVLRGVEFVAVGGFAALLHGAQRATTDIDLCVAWSEDNLERIAAALGDLNAELKLDRYIEVPIDATLPAVRRSRRGGRGAWMSTSCLVSRATNGGNSFGMRNCEMAATSLRWVISSWQSHLSTTSSGRRR